MNTGLVDRLDRPPGMMFDASTSSPDKSSMTSEFSESESTVFFFFCFLSFFCFFFGRSSSSSVLSASSCSSQSPRRSKVSLKVVGFSIIARLDTKMHKWRERERERERSPSHHHHHQNDVCASRKNNENKKTNEPTRGVSETLRTSSSSSSSSSFSTFFGRSPSDSELSLSNTTPIFWNF